MPRSPLWARLISEASARSRSRGASCRRLGQGSTSASTAVLGGEVRAAAAVTGARTMKSPRSGLRPFAPRNNSPLCRMPRPRLRSTETTRKSSRSRAWPNQCSASATRLTSLSMRPARRACGRAAREGHVALAEDRRLCRTDSGGALDHAGRPTQRPAMRSTCQVRRRDAAADAVLDEIGDDRRGLPIDPDRHGELRRMSARKLVTAIVIVVGGEFDADDMRGVRVELEHDPGPPARCVAHAADLLGNDQPVVEQRRRDRRNGRRAELGELGDLDPGDRAEAAGSRPSRGSD